MKAYFSVIIDTMELEKYTVGGIFVSTSENNDIVTFDQNKHSGIVTAYITAGNFIMTQEMLTKATKLDKYEHVVKICERADYLQSRREFQDNKYEDHNYCNTERRWNRKEYEYYSGGSDMEEFSTSSIYDDSDNSETEDFDGGSCPDPGECYSCDSD
jgi:hypothetical protein